MSKVVEVELKNGMSVSLEEDGVVARMSAPDGDSKTKLRICTAAVRSALNVAHDIGGQKAARAVLGAGKQLYRLDVKKNELEQQRARELWDDDLEV